MKTDEQKVRVQQKRNAADCKKEPVGIELQRVSQSVLRPKTKPSLRCDARDCLRSLGARFGAGLVLLLLQGFHPMGFHIEPAILTPIVLATMGRGEIRRLLGNLAKKSGSSGQK